MVCFSDFDFLVIRALAEHIPLQQRMQLRTLNRLFCEAIDSIPIRRAEIRFTSSESEESEELEEIGQDEIRLKRYSPVWNECRLKYVRHLSIDGQLSRLELSHLQYLESLELYHSEMLTIKNPLPTVKRLILLDGSATTSLLKKFPNLKCLVVRDMRYPTNNRHEFKLRKYQVY